MNTSEMNEQLKELLKSISVFALFRAAELEELAGAFALTRYTLGQTVVQAGEESDAFFVVYSGRASVVTERQGEEIIVGTLTRGNHLGEQGLLRNARREFTVRAADDLVLLRLARNDFERLLGAHPDLGRYFEQYVSEVSVRNFLKLCTVFSPLTDVEIRDLLACLETREYQASAVIVREGDPGDAFYILRSGSVEVVKDSDGGRILNRLQPGDFFGELALLLGQPRAASVVAKEPSSVFRLEKRDFDRILMAAPKARQAIAAAAAGYTGSQPVPDGSAATESTPPVTTDLPRKSRYPVVLQQSEAEGAAACLSMILQYHHKEVSESRIRAVCKPAHGSPLSGLAEAAESLGLQARSLHAKFENLSTIERPAVALWEGSRYVVLYEVNDDAVVIADPAVGLRRLSRDEFLHGWAGQLLLLSPAPRLEVLTEGKRTLGNLFALLVPYRRQFFQILLLSLCLQLFNLATPIFTQVVVDRVIVQRNSALLNTMLFGMMMVATCQILTVALRRYLMVHTSRRIDLAMAVNFYRHMLSLPLPFFEQRHVGDILKRFSDNEKVRELVTGRGFISILDCVMIVVYFAMMLFYNVRLTLLTTLFLAGYAILTFVMTPMLKKLNRESFTRSAEAQSILVEAVSGIGTVKATTAERPVRWKWEGLMVKALNLRFRTAMTGVTMSSMSTLLQMLNSTFLLWFGAKLVLGGQLSIGQLMAFTALAANVNFPVVMIISLWGDFQEVRVALERLSDVYETKPEEIPSPKGLIQIPPVRGHVRFENVSFSYPSRPDRRALQNVDFEVLPGQSVALVGRSGAGKSTFAGLLMQLHRPDEGRILVDGYDLRQVSIASLRRQIGVVPQDVVLFSGTIRENIAFSDPDTPLEEAVGAAMLAGAHEFIIGLPDGYETVVGERGQSLSGGQKQRIAIARALFKKPRILIFDEATSALDNESERAIQQNLDQILRGRTTFIIAHRLSTIRNADCILVLDGGRIVETGTHYSLMELKGMYYYLNSQRFEQ